MVLKYATYRLQCTHPFKISRSSNSYYDRVFVYLEQDGLVGRGEAAPSERYKESVPKILKILSEEITLPKNVIDVEELVISFTDYSQGIKALRSALISALYDWWAQKNGIAVTDYFQLEKICIKPTSFTIAISSESELVKKIEEASQFQILKIKLGTDRDKEIINTIRAITDKPIRIDANEGWDIETALEMCQWLIDKNVELIEQPMSVENTDQMAELMKISTIPLIADENCKTVSDIEDIIGKFDGINIKLAKCGGLDEALKMVKHAKSSGLKVMLGCMVESSIGITAIGQLISQADYIDLDGNLLIDNDPYSGLEVRGGVPKLAGGKGLGLSLRNNYIDQNNKLI